MRRFWRLSLAIVCSALGGLLSLLCAPTWAHHAAQHEPPALRDVGFDQRLNAQIPLDLVFRDENGNPVQLGAFFGEKPVILVLAYYECPMLCTLVLKGLLRTLRALSFEIGKQFNVVTVSIDPGETPTLAAATKQQYLRAYGRPGAAVGWHFLTGEATAIASLARSVGFRYAYDADQDQYAHAAGIMVLTPPGKIARYLYGIEFSPRDLRLGLVEAAANTIGSPVDHLLLSCYQYDPVTGKYGLLVTNVLRLACFTTVLGLGVVMSVMCRRDRPKKARLEA